MDVNENEWMTEEFNPPGTFDLKGKKPKVKSKLRNEIARRGISIVKVPVTNE